MYQMLFYATRQLSTPSRVLFTQTASFYNKVKIGNRDIVGYGINGEYGYLDNRMYPLPAIRFCENTSDVLALREKEKGDWRKLTVEEKKALYRASFCQTFSEMKAPSGEWKVMIAGVLVASSLALWFYIWLRKYVYGELPSSFSDESKKAQLKRMIAMRVNPIEGLASKWDYEKGKWKD